MTQDEKRQPEAGGAGQPPKEPSGIHVDGDWKKQARAEKEQLAREAERPEPAADDVEAADDEGFEGPLPPASFTSLVETLATQAAIFMSNHRDPETGRSVRNLDLAKHNIDLLGVLEEKTKGNLTDEEKQLLDRLLYELRMAYVSAAS